MNIFWFRRDLRLSDNVGLHYALQQGNVKPIFIFDIDIIQKLEKNDSRLSFIHTTISQINTILSKYNTSIHCYYGKPEEIWADIVKNNDIESVFWNRDYEPYAIKRDRSITNILELNNSTIHTFKDQVIFEKNEISKENGLPYTIYTPYKNKWLSTFSNINRIDYSIKFENFIQQKKPMLSLEKMGFLKSKITVKPFTFSGLGEYHLIRDFPNRDETSHLSPHLRFGTISVRECVQKASKINSTFLSELIWREFFMQIIFHFPHVVKNCFKNKYDKIKWNNNIDDFELWCQGNTGYPIVDAGMRQLNQTGYMHNRVRMITASFLIKHLLIDWRWGESYFAKKLLDYDLSANNGNWQWAAGTGCDSAPYFRIFNPITQLKKFDPKMEYVRKWVKEINTPKYPNAIIDHKIARERCLITYKKVV